jgi:hypothetical protein
MSFIRVKTHPSGRQYLYEEIRGSHGYQKSTSLGRIGSGFFFWLGVLISNVTEPNAFSLDTYYDEQEAQRRDFERSQQERDRLAEVVDPTSYGPAASEDPVEGLRQAPVASPEVTTLAPAPSTEDSELDEPSLEPDVVGYSPSPSSSEPDAGQPEGEASPDGSEGSAAPA